MPIQLLHDAQALQQRTVALRREIHRHPELGLDLPRTRAAVLESLQGLDLELVLSDATSGIVATLHGAEPGPAVLLRGDMDALPMPEDTGLPFASEEAGCMHACGHDAHTAMLLGAAHVLAAVRDQLPGTVVFVFQPAEERPPPGEDGGAQLLLREGGLDAPRPDAIFALHVVPEYPVGTLAWRAGGAMASSDRMRIVVHGRQTHAAKPWEGIDPIAAASRIVLGLQAIPGRQTDARKPAVVSIGAIHGGVRNNIIPDQVELLGTIRSLDPEQRLELHERVRRTATALAESSGARAEVEIDVARGYPVTWNDPELARRMLPTLERVAPVVVEAPPRTGAEDFAFYAQQIPGLYLWLGVRSPDLDAADAAPNHSPRFLVDEDALPLGVRTLSHLALDYLTTAP